MSRASWVLTAAWVLLVGGYVLAALTQRNSPRLTAFGDVVRAWSLYSHAWASSRIPSFLSIARAFFGPYLGWDARRG